jgi:hypothetical protein
VAPLNFQVGGLDFVQTKLSFVTIRSVQAKLWTSNILRYIKTRTLNVQKHVQTRSECLEKKKILKETSSSKNQKFQNRLSLLQVLFCYLDNQHWRYRSFYIE